MSTNTCPQPLPLQPSPQTLPLHPSPQPLPLQDKTRNDEYDSGFINKDRLYDVETMLMTNIYLVTKQNSSGTLAQLLARRAVFGYDCLIQCTPLGSSIYLALPSEEIFNIKILYIYSHYILSYGILLVSLNRCGVNVALPSSRHVAG